jgi:hypothetical protein
MVYLVAKKRRTDRRLKVYSVAQTTASQFEGTFVHLLPVHLWPAHHLRIAATSSTTTNVEHKGQKPGNIPALTQFD